MIFKSKQIIHMVPSVSRKKGLKNFLLNVLVVTLQLKTSLPEYINTSESQAKCEFDNKLIQKLNDFLPS